MKNKKKKKKSASREPSDTLPGYHAPKRIASTNSLFVGIIILYLVVLFMYAFMYVCIYVMS